MNASRIALMLWSLPILVCGQGRAAASQAAAPCKAESLPSDIQNRLKAEYGSWKIQEPANLTKSAEERWEAEKPLGCPGIAVGHFESAKTPSYAILLVPTAHADAGYTFLVFSQKPGQPEYDVRVVDKLDKNGASNYFIHSTRISKFFDQPSRKKFEAHALDGILLVDSGENEYGVAFYFWSGDNYRYEPVDY